MSDEKPTSDGTPEVEVVSPWVYLNRTTPLALDYGDTGVQDGEPEREEHESYQPYGGLTVEEVKPQRVVRPAPEALGVPVPLEQHRAAFVRKWDKTKGAIPREPYVAPKPSAPRVSCRDASEDEMPREVWEYLCALASQQHAMLQLRATYAQAGDDRLLKQTGQCNACGMVTTVNADGSLKSHARPKAGKCPGVGIEPSNTDGEKGSCPFCDGVKKLTKKGLLPSHDAPSVKCTFDTNAESAAQAFTMLPPTTLPPIQSLILRCVWSKTEYAFGCYLWDDLADNGNGAWKFDDAFIRGDETAEFAVHPHQVGVTAWRAFMDARVRQMQQVA